MDKIENVENEIKDLIISTLNLEGLTSGEISVDEPLFGDGLGLDSIDALELGVAVKKRYNLTLDVETDDIKKHFYSVRSLADFVSRAQVGQL